MSQYVVLAIVAVIALVLWKRFVPPPSPRDSDEALRRDAKTLERDPATGVYRQSEPERTPRRDRGA